MIVKHGRCPTFTVEPHPSLSCFLSPPPPPADPSGHPAANAPSDTSSTLKSPLHQKGGFYTSYIYEGCFFFRRRLSRDKSNRLCYPYPTLILTPRLSVKSKVRMLRYAYYTGITSRCLCIQLPALRYCTLYGGRIK